MFKTLFWSVLLSGNALIAAPGDITGYFSSPSKYPSGMAFDGHYLWVADFKSDSLYKIDLTDGGIVTAIPAPAYRPQGIAWDGECLWVIDAEDLNLYRLDPVTGMAVKTLTSPLSKPTGLAWDGVSLWLADATSINKVSSTDGTIIKSFRAPAFATTGLTFDGAYLWAADRIRDRLYMIDPGTGDVILMLDSPAPYPWGLACVDGQLVNVDYETDRIYSLVIDDGTEKVQVNGQRENMNYTHEVRNYGPGTLSTLEIYLAIPQDSDRQRLLTEPVYYSEATPEHVTDRWGQSYAAFHFKDVPPGGRISASYLVTAELYETRHFIFPEKVQGPEAIPQDIKDNFLKDELKFAIGNKVVRDAVAEAIGGETNPYWKARKIYDWIIEHFTYELAGGWSYAPAVIQRGSGSCSEYAFAFIAMCRAAGIPARYTGAVTMRGDRASDDEVFHRWAEIYLPPYGWIPVDPSGGDSPSPEKQAGTFGAVHNGYLITTTGSGSEYIGWDYNSGERYYSDGICKVYSENIGHWSPADSITVVDEMPAGGMYCRPDTTPINDP